MTKKKSMQSPFKPYRGWLLSYRGNPWIVVNRRDHAKRYAESNTGDQWEICKRNFRITRVEVKPV